MIEWKSNKLYDLCIFIKDGTHGTFMDVEDGIPLLSAKDIIGGKVCIPHDSRRISINDYNSIHSNYELKDDDLLLTIVGTIGRSAIISNLVSKFTFQRSVAIFRTDKIKLDPLYCFHFFNSNNFLSTLERSKNASAQGGVYLGELEKIQIKYPISIYDQRKIAHILSSSDAVIEKTEAAIAKYKSIKNGMLQDLFTRGIDLNTGKLRPKPEDAPEQYKKSELGLIPNEWDEKQIDEVLDTIMSNVDKHIYENENNVLLCNYMDVYKNRYITNTIDFMNGTVNLIEEQKFKLKHEDVVITKDSETPDEIAVPTVIEAMLDNLICGYHLCILREKIANSIYGPFLMNQLLVFEINRQFAIRANGSTRFGLTLKSIHEVKIKIPKDYFEQIEIARRIKTIDQKISKEELLLNKYNSIKKGLMDDLLTGKLEVKSDKVN